MPKLERRRQCDPDFEVPDVLPIDGFPDNFVAEARNGSPFAGYCVKI